MLDLLQRLEDQLVRLEGAILVALVLLMLSLAVYNVFYRNVLVPLQVEVTTEEISPEERERRLEAKALEEEAAPEKEEAAAQAEDSDEPAGGFGGGFGGDFAGDEEPEEDAAPSDDGQEVADGLGGDFGEDAEESPGLDEDVADVDEVEDEEEEGAEGFAGGFGGGFEEDGEEDTAGGFGGGFGDAEVPEEGERSTEKGQSAAEEADAAEAADGEESEAPETVTVAVTPEEGSAGDLVYRTIEAMKIEWIDVLLRQLVLIVGFLGAMLATRRKKHITIDALSLALPPGALGWVRLATNGLSIAVCILLAISGARLVAISLQFPGELMWWADESTFQLAFPIGFGLLALHFAIRFLEVVAALITGEGLDVPDPVEFKRTGGES